MIEPTTPLDNETLDAIEHRARDGHNLAQRPSDVLALVLEVRRLRKATSAPDSSD